MTSGNVLIVGGDGFLGRHTAEALAAGGASVHVFDRPGSTPPPRPRGAHRYGRYEGSVTDRGALEEAVADAGADAIVVLASYSHGGLGLAKAAEQNPPAAVEVNVRGLLHVLEIAARRPGTRVVWLSSTTVYGPTDRYAATGVSEDALLAPGSVYAATKVLGEQLVRTYRTAHGVRATAVRPTLVWGPGLRYRGVQSCLGDLADAAAHGREATVPDSDEPWDLLYVRDAGRAVAWLTGRDLGPVVLVNGYRASVRQVREAVLRAVPGAPVRVAGAAPRLNVPPVDDGRIRRAGFVPEFDLARSVYDYVATLSASTA
ncbi:NAD-dependent epimerase/dehydratase family protein [Actinomadura chibensis]|uniref:NAD-dependent epimerase/dehydratase family protein n=1 Tax=Actinomadura chibensis TaxID=392828 RepID=UPI000831BA10|nr:NAD(P)-dependent oxidoreductase [Actinomadura chibensis]